jgi:GNAT superfamily N-acetyltransferase
MDGGTGVVGMATAYLALQENTDTVSLGIRVHPAFRGRGVATALIEDGLKPVIRESGRSLVELWSEVPADGDADDPRLPSNVIASRLGVSRKNMAVCRALTFPLRPGLLDELDAQAAEKIDGYRVELWEDTVPEDHLVAYGVLLRQLELDDPDEGIEYEVPEYTPERIRTAEKRRADAGTRDITAVAIAPDGTFAGNSVIQLQAAAGTTLAFQENTLVMPEYRGHRLGLALKVATHRVLAEQFPEVRTLVTWNSHVNPWMIGINEQLGYEVAFREIGYQGRPGF